MENQDLLIGYLIFCVAVFLYSLLTAHEDTIIMRSTDDPNYPSLFTWSSEHLMTFGAMLFFSFCPVLNLGMLVSTILYRKGLL